MLQQIFTVLMSPLMAASTFELGR